MKIYDTKGSHAIADLWGVDKKFDDIELMKKIMLDALKTENIEPLGILQEQFHPQGLTILMLLSESHYSVHFYSEDHFLFLAADIYTCGEANSNKILDYFISVLEPKKVYRQSIVRGVR